MQNSSFGSKGACASVLEDAVPHPECPVERQCGACQHISVAYADQLAAKDAQVAKLFAQVADPSALLPILGMEDPYYYRNKVASPYAPGRKLPAPGGKGEKPIADLIAADKANPHPLVRLQFHGSKEGRGKSGKGGKNGKGAAPRREILCGMYAAGTHRIVSTDACLLENQQAKRIIRAIRDLMPRYGITPYDEDKGVGFLRHAIVRVGHTSEEVLVTLVTNGREFPASRNFCRDLVKRCPGVTTVVQNVNERQTNVILGQREQTLYGPRSTQFRLKFCTAVPSKLAGIHRQRGAIDAYCGTGTGRLVAAKHGRRAGDGRGQAWLRAIRDARENARHSRVENARFVVGDAAISMREQAADGQRVDVLLMDPPRAGASEEFLHAAVALAPKRMVYISCNPTTQVRDLAFLRDRGFTVKVVQPVDMFPHTDHIETIALIVAPANRNLPSSF